MGYLKYVKEAHQNIKSKTKEKGQEDLRTLMRERKIAWRNKPPIGRIERPTRMDKAKQYGYKSKQGIIVVRARVGRGSMSKPRPDKGRKPKRMGVSKLTAAKSKQRIAEERVQKKFINLEVLGSYWLWEDGQNQWYEVILADPAHPAIKKDKDLGWLAKPHQKNRALRGLTPAGTKGRGQTKKGKGAEKVRPSLRAKGRKAK